MLYQLDRPHLARAIRLVPLAFWLAWLALFPPAPAQALALTAARKPNSAPPSSPSTPPARATTPSP